MINMKIVITDENVIDYVRESDLFKRIKEKCFFGISKLPDKLTFLDLLLSEYSINDLSLLEDELKTLASYKKLGDISNIKKAIFESNKYVKAYCHLQAFLGSYGVSITPDNDGINELSQLKEKLDLLEEYKSTGRTPNEINKKFNFIGNK